jgi:hypothetical protein
MSFRVLSPARVADCLDDASAWAFSLDEAQAVVTSMSRLAGVRHVTLERTMSLTADPTTGLDQFLLGLMADDSPAEGWMSRVGRVDVVIVGPLGMSGPGLHE